MSRRYTDYDMCTLTCVISVYDNSTNGVLVNYWEHNGKELSKNSIDVDNVTHFARTIDLIREMPIGSIIVNYKGSRILNHADSNIMTEFTKDPDGWIITNVKKE